MIALCCRPLCRAPFERRGKKPAWCPACAHEYMLAYYAAHRDELRAKARARYGYHEASEHAPWRTSVARSYGRARCGP